MTTRDTVYTDEFFSGQRESARRSAGIFVPLVIALTAPRSVVDVGCGTGTWLTVFEELGVDDSAAIPGQGGTKHVNEQWPAYWARLFAEHGYVHVDSLRRQLWHDDAVAPCYAQNTLLYVAADELARHEALARAHEAGEPVPLALVHPTRYLEWVEWGRTHVCS